MYAWASSRFSCFYCRRTGDCKEFIGVYLFVYMLCPTSLHVEQKKRMINGLNGWGQNALLDCSPPNKPLANILVLQRHSSNSDISLSLLRLSSNKTKLAGLSKALLNLKSLYMDKQ